MTADAIRKKFLDFFKNKEHTIIRSDSLVPKDDPTVLFTTAGMQQFKRQFLGFVDDYKRAATSQKCLRTDDLDEVGETDFHHTFFEMLGNFSFGDYFKKEAIHWAWEFLTKEMGIAPERLWVSVYHEDTEAEAIWKNDIQLPSAKIVRLGDKSNFWPANAKQNGPNGPCGPCSEIFFDYGINADCTSEVCDPSCDCGRFSEIWNLVFTQYNRKDGGELEPLPNKNIDTGMGLERLAAVVQGKRNNYETDLFAPVLAAIDATAEKHSVSLTLKEKRIIADHIRAVVIAINDGVIPSNKERGSVVKRLIVDSTNILLSRGAREPLFYTLVPSVNVALQTPYPELAETENETMTLIRRVEENFVAVRQQRIPELLETNLAGLTSEARGGIYFRFHDTYGLPISTILETAREAGVEEQDLTEDMTYYRSLLEEQKDRSRSASKLSADVFTNTGLDLNIPKSEFIGYDHFEGRAKVLKVIKGAQDKDVTVILDRTPFYAESGGQVGDQGWLLKENGRFRVLDTQKSDDIFIHTGTVEEGSFQEGDELEARVDVERRRDIMRNHTATHILQAALRQVLGPHIQQQGSLVDAERLRFDFTHPKALTTEEVRAVEDYVNSAILKCQSLVKERLPIADARKSGALAFFAEKYGDIVRVVSIGDFSKEFCGGTHLESTGEIGILKITAEGAIAQGIRRLEAKTGRAALQHIAEEETLLQKAAALLKSPPQELLERLEVQTQRLRSLEKDLKQYRFQSLKETLETLLASAPSSNGSPRVITHTFEDVDMNLLRQCADHLKQKSGSSVLLLAARGQESAAILMSVSDDLVKKGLRANEIISEIAPLIGGKGGGRPQLAQAGSKESGKLDQALAQAQQLILEKMPL